ncbi:hypothetical protein RHMOL_Rhmol01G0072300 [Rhododendron molle]|uniref:Uncharacterized protein n=1 Tax=Rhododendron molle TaxID=49168 RepID=A0ACC0Q270_RHOML|nr:hypothetical protein RHMOL_Rhmol01G0072300 [Rhododendron molle]
MSPSRGADRIGVSLGSHRPTVILKLPCLVEKKRTKAFPVAPIPPTPRTLSGPRAIVSCCFHLVVFFVSLLIPARPSQMMSAVMELKTQLEILQTKIRIKEQRLMDKMNIVKEMELAQEKEIEVSIPPHQKLQLEQELPRLPCLQSWLTLWHMSEFPHLY